MTTIRLLSISDASTLRRSSLRSPDDILFAFQLGAVARGGVVIRAPRSHITVLLRLLARTPACVPVADLVDALYSEREDGGPETATACATKFVWDIQPVAAVIGIQIERGGRGVYVEIAPMEAA